MGRRGEPVRGGTVVVMIEVLMNIVSVLGSIVLLLMLLAIAVLPILQEWEERR